MTTKKKTTSKAKKPAAKSRAKKPAAKKNADQTQNFDMDDMSSRTTAEFRQRNFEGAAKFIKCCPDDQLPTLLRRVAGSLGLG